MPFGLLGLHVHLSGNHDLIGPVVLAITAVAAAVIAARTANTRQAAQLAHDRQLQSELQSERLAYDRDQRNRQHIRDTVDDVLRRIDDAVRVIVEYEAKVVVENERRSAHREIVNGETEASPVQREEAAQALRAETASIQASRTASNEMSIELSFQSTRLGIRLGGNHPVVRGHQALRHAYSARKSALDGLDKAPLSDEDRSELQSNADSFNDAMISFFKACRTWFESN